MKEFLKNLSVFCLIILLPLVVGYLYFDPFRVLYNYSEFNVPSYIDLDRDYVSTEMFIKHKDQYHYNSFILGSSRTVAFNVSSWQKYLDANASPFKYDAYGESIYGIYKKLKYLDATHAKIDNVLLIIDEDLTFNTYQNVKEVLGIKHPAISGESRIMFQKVFFRAYLNPKFLYTFYSGTLARAFKNKTKNSEDQHLAIMDTVTNQLTWTSSDNRIEEDSIGYYANAKSFFYARSGETVDKMQKIRGIRLSMLQEIGDILKKNNTHYKVIISPIYDQVKFSDEDRKVLKEIFGENLYDFSGKNAFTDSPGNYYRDAYHYRPMVGDSILKIIYEPASN